MKIFNNKSFFVSIIVFWVFCSVPRFWYYIEEKILFEALQDNLLTILIGFISDGALVSPLLLFFQLFNRKIFKLPGVMLDITHALFTIFLGFIIFLMMANVEFFRYFGSNANLTHFSFAADSEILIPSLTAIFPLRKILVGLVFIPVLYIFISRMTSGWVLGQLLQKRSSFFISGLIFLLGVFSVNIGEHNDPLKKNLENNYVISFFKYLIFGDDIRGKSSEPIEKLLDTKPLIKSEGAYQQWHYFDPKYPLIQATEHDLCVMNLWEEKLCNKDSDQDGVPLKYDCNDQAPNINPNQIDIPGNSVDEDCSGIDSNPPNIIFIHWEGARAVNIGSIGYSDPVTPRFDTLAKKGRLYRNAYANGTQTRWSLTSVYNSILPRLSTKWIFKHNPELNVLAFPLILRNHGYQTYYIHGGSINFGNLKSMFWEWFEVMLDKTIPPIKDMPKLGWGLKDKDLFDFCYDTLEKRTDSRPFYMTIATLSLHHPFHLPDNKHALYPHKSMNKKYKNILHYSDEQMGNFIEKIQSNKKFENTIILIAADHGMNTGSPHKTTAQATLWEDLVWIPILLVGEKWNIPPGIDDSIRQLADIGPTILDRLGIEMPNHFIGHSLLKNYPDNRHPISFFGNANGGISAGMRMGKFKYFVSFEGPSHRLYDISVDRQEKNNLAVYPEYKDTVEKMYKMVTDVYVQHTKLIKENRIWNWDYGMKVKRGKSF